MRFRFDELVGASEHARAVLEPRIERDRRAGVRIEPDEPDAARELRAVVFDVPEELRFRRDDDILRRLTERKFDERRRLDVDANEVGDEPVSVPERRRRVAHRAQRLLDAGAQPFVFSQLVVVNRRAFVIRCAFPFEVGDFDLSGSELAPQVLAAPFEVVEPGKGRVPFRFELGLFSLERLNFLGKFRLLPFDVLVLTLFLDARLFERAAARFEPGKFAEEPADLAVFLLRSLRAFSARA